MPNTPPPRRPKQGNWSPMDAGDDPDLATATGTGDTPRRARIDTGERPTGARVSPASSATRRAARDASREARAAGGDTAKAAADAPARRERGGTERSDWKRPRLDTRPDTGSEDGTDRPDAAPRTGWRGSDRGRGPDRGTRWPKGPLKPSVAIAGDDRLFIFGSHAVEAALANPRRTIRHLWLTENAQRRLATALEGRDFTIESVTPRDLDKRLGADTVHQGALVEADALPDVELIDLIIPPDTDAGRALPPGPIVVLDQVTDPHNVGAILRSAAVFGARGVVMTRRHSPPLGGALAKAASGALDQVAVALVQNLAKAMSDLTDAGVTVIGLDGEAETLLEDLPFTGPTAIVLGAEGKGLRELTRNSCSVLARITGDGPLTSLNVSNAAAISLHFAGVKRRQGGKS